MRSWLLIILSTLTVHAADRVPDLSFQHFVRALNAGKVVVDARGTAMHKDGHIQGTIDIGAKDFSQRLPQRSEHPDYTVLWR